MCTDLFLRLGDANLALDVNVAFAGGTGVADADLGVKRGSVAEKIRVLVRLQPRLPRAVNFLGAIKKWVREEGSSIQKKTVGTCIRRLVIRASASLARSLGLSVLAYRKVCQKGAGCAGV
jgi:hypothetical protein